MFLDTNANRKSLLVKCLIVHIMLLKKTYDGILGNITLNLKVLV